MQDPVVKHLIVFIVFPEVTGFTEFIEVKYLQCLIYLTLVIECLEVIVDLHLTEYLVDQFLTEVMQLTLDLAVLEVMLLM